MAEKFFNLDEQKSQQAGQEPAAFDYSEFKEAPSEGGSNVLTQMAAMAAEQKAAEAEVERLDDELKKAKERLRYIRETKIPDFMEQNQMSDVTTADGIRVEITEEIRGSIPKANEPKAFTWLEDNNHGSVIKREIKIEFGKGEEAWASKFMRDMAQRKRPLKSTVKKAVHPQTLQALVRELLGRGEKFPMDVFGVHRQRVSKITVK